MKILSIIVFISIFFLQICYGDFKDLSGEVAIVSAEASSWSVENLPKNVLPGVSGLWYSKGGSMPEWIEVTLEKPQEINAVYINFGLGAMRYAIDYKIEVMNEDTQIWKSIKNIMDNKKEEVVEIFSPVSVVKLRLFVTKTYQSDNTQRVDEIRLYKLPSEQIQSFEDTKSFEQSIETLLNKAHSSINPGQPISSIIKDSTGNIGISENQTHYFFSSLQYNITLNKESGFLSSLQSLNPAPMEIVSPMKKGMILYVWCKDPGHQWYEIFDRFKMQKSSSGEDDLGKYLELGGDIYSTAENLNQTAQGIIRYRLYKDLLSIKIDLTYLRSDPSLYEIGVLQAYNPSLWDTHIYPGTSRHIEIPASDINKHPIFFADSKKDNSYQLAVWHPELSIGGQGAAVSYPYGVLQNETRFFLWGYRDLGAFTILAPGNREHNPSFIISPKGINAGEGYSFDFFYKFFPKPENTYTDVVRWYAQNVYSTDPVAQGIVTMPKDLPHRTLPEGNYGGYGFTWSSFSEYFPNAYKENEAAMLKLKMINIHDAYWYDMAETYPTEGEWYASQMSLRKVSAEALKKDFARLKSEGFNNYLYFRQVFNSFGVYDDKPPYKRWQRFYKDGLVYSYSDIWHPIDRDYAERFGLDPNKKMGYPWADFYNDDFRNWYIQRVKDCVTYYNLDGVFWDMGWIDIGQGYTASDSIGGSGIHNGILRVQCEIYKWLKSFNPPKYVITNQSLASPSALYADAVLFEGGNVPKRTVEAQKAFNTTIINLSYSESYGGSTPEEHIRTILRAMSYGVSWGGHGYEFFEHPDKRDPCHTRPLGLYLLPLTELASFSALSNNIPLVTESHSVTVKSAPEVTASLWASDKAILVAIYNDGESKQKYEILIDKDIVTKYLKDKGKLDSAFQSIPPDAILHLGKDGKPVSPVVIQTDKDQKYYILKGEIDPHHLIGIKKISKELL